MDSRLNDMKRKIRDLKKSELRIRFGSEEAPKGAYIVWNGFFGTGSEKGPGYTLERLLCMDREEFRQAVSLFFCAVYFEYYRENGLLNRQAFDPALLRRMDLPADADAEQVKKQFRSLAKKYHPDTGGEAGKFIELIDNYRKLIEKGEHTGE
ncbi:MAG: J domain-containing protein [Clostridiales bacterium]|nr:J domain-containing protein [Clostridiales bacterium]